MSGEGSRNRRIGDKLEREIVQKHIELGIKAERYPLSGATKFRGSGHDIDIYALGNDEAPLVAEAKQRKDGEGFAQLERWLGDYDALFLHRARAEPMVIIPWRVWVQLLGSDGQWQRERRKRQRDATSEKPEVAPDAVAGNGGLHGTERTETDGVGPSVAQSGEGPT